MDISAKSPGIGARRDDDLISVGVFVFIREREDEQNFLLVRDVYKDGKLSLPGGAPHMGELMLEAAMREVWEETGFYIRVVRTIGIFPTRKTPGIVILFEGVIIGGALRPQDDQEISEAKFCRFEDLQETEVYPFQYKLIRQARVPGLDRLHFDWDY